MSDGGEAAGLPSTVLGELVDLPQADAVALLREGGWWNVSVAMVLAEWALERAEVDTTHAEAALALATMISLEHGEPPSLRGQIAYAEARRAVHTGDLGAAEVALLRAQESWQAVDARAPYARTFLGLTQVLTMQGRYGEAGAAAQGAIHALNVLAEIDPAARLLLSRAYRNRANLFVYQEQHAAARDAYLQAIDELQRFQAAFPPGDDDAERRTLEAEFGHLALNLASTHTFLDAPNEAESLLLEAVARFELAQDDVNRGRGLTNLGRLYLRLGEYTSALTAFDLATRYLIGDVPLYTAAEPNAEVASLRQADELLLEHALAYLSLNLLPEAALALDRCERLFRATGQPYELAQSLYTQGVLRLQQGTLNESQAALDEAYAIYATLDNRFWRNRTQTARARLALAKGERDRAEALVNELLAAPAMTTPTGAVAWDLSGLIDVWLMRLQLWLDVGEAGQAERAAQAVEQLLGGISSAAAGVPDATPPLSHLSLRLMHSRGRIAAAVGDDALARRFFSSAVELLDRQRAALPLEEVRTAYLGDKMAIYSDLVVSLLASPLPSEDEVAAAFAVVERARSRALLERLLVSVEAGAEGESAGDESAEVREQRASLRRQLHWLYNQLLGDSGARHLDGTLGREVAQHEAALQQLEWRHAPILAQAEPVHLPELQAMLAQDQQALAYYFADHEVLAFVVGRGGAQVVRRLATIEAVAQAHSELRFQLGRAELGPEYVARHQARLMQGVNEALARLYELLVAPLKPHLTAKRLLLIPYGLLHLIPFHALWDGAGYWLEEVEITYVPSASIAVRKQRDKCDVPLRCFAGFAPYDERIPQAQAEIDHAAQFFAEERRYHGNTATLANLRAAATTSDVLHLATHGLFRADNSFFSAIKLADGWMDVREIYRLSLAARLVVLSACESGVGEVRAGDEVVGLARGFLAAGSRDLVATLWNVHDSSAAELMESFYAALQGQSTPRVANGRNNELENERNGGRTAAALRAAQLRARHKGQHPYYWAPFFAIG